MTEMEPTPLTDRDEQLLRQVHPVHLSTGVLSKAAFLPGSSDDGQLSTLRGRVGASEAYRRWTEENGLKSAGTWAVTVGEAANAGLHCVDDEVLPDVPPDHASIDFNSLQSKNAVRQAARKLREHADARGCLHAGEGDSTH